MVANYGLKTTLKYVSMLPMREQETPGLSTPQVKFGNVQQDRNERQWLVGYFRGPNSGLLHQTDVEIKTANHQAGEKSSGWTKNSVSTTFTIVINGKFFTRIRNYETSSEQEFILEPGDYLIFAPNVLHTWEALENSTVITFRWPSSPQSQVSEQ